MSELPAPLAVGRYPGIEIDYYERPYRRYLLNSGEVPSVTTAIHVANNPDPLMHYAERCTSEGMGMLARRSGYQFPADMRVPQGARGFRLPKRVNDHPSNGAWLFRWGEVDRLSKSEPKSLIRIGKEWSTLTGARIALGHLALLGLDHRSQTTNAANRGLDVHQVWEDWNTRQLIPDANSYPADRRGYIRAMAKAIMEYQPECVEAENVVGSAVHGFAGRLDTVVVVRTKKGLAMWDVKTSRSIYPESHFPQLIGYEIARRECGLEPTEHQGILRLAADGTFEVGWSDAKPQDFLCLLAAYKSQSRWTKKRRRG